MSLPVTIVGGGLAGLTLGIGLRQAGVPVTIFESGDYPRHRVCGEFISGRGQAVLERLGLLGDFEKAGAIYARTAMFISGAAKSPVRKLATPALCLSRYKMDALLAAKFQDLGGELRVRSRWNSEPPHEAIRQGLDTRPQRARPHPGPLPQEREKCPPMVGNDKGSFPFLNWIRDSGIGKTGTGRPPGRPGRTGANRRWNRTRNGPSSPTRGE